MAAGASCGWCQCATDTVQVVQCAASNTSDINATQSNNKQPQQQQQQKKKQCKADTDDDDEDIFAYSFSQLCVHCCCPFCPPRIASKLAFYPPRPSTYTTRPVGPSPLSHHAQLQPPPPPPPPPAAAAATALEVEPLILEMTDKVDWIKSTEELERVEVFSVKTSRRTTLSCVYVHCSAGTIPVRQVSDALPSPSEVQPAAAAAASPTVNTVLFSHGNSDDLGTILRYYMYITNRLKCDVFSYDYSGYGKSSGRPTEKNMYRDIETAWRTLTTHCAVSPQHIVLYGFSIGTVPTVHLATQHQVAAVVLDSGLTSGLRLMCPCITSTHCFDVFTIIDRVDGILSPVLVIHGTDDQTIDISHGLQLFERCPRALRLTPLWVKGAGHCDVAQHKVYFDRLNRLLHDEIPQLSAASVAAADKNSNQHAAVWSTGSTELAAGQLGSCGRRNTTAEHCGPRGRASAKVCPLTTASLMGSNVPATSRLTGSCSTPETGPTPPAYDVTRSASSVSAVRLQVVVVKPPQSSSRTARDVHLALGSEATEAAPPAAAATITAQDAIASQTDTVTSRGLVSKITFVSSFQ